MKTKFLILNQYEMKVHLDPAEHHGSYNLGPLHAYSCLWTALFDHTMHVPWSTADSPLTHYRRWIWFNTPKQHFIPGKKKKKKKKKISNT